MSRRLPPLSHPIDAEVRVPGDKSISHRALILGTLARGRSDLANLSPARDVAATAAVLAASGASLELFDDGRVGLGGARAAAPALRSPAGVLDCANSGTTMRLVAGVLAGHAIDAVLDGDESLRRRPMERVAAPLRALGATVECSDGHAPIRVRGTPRPRALVHRLEVASAQVKSAILLAGLFAEGPTTVAEPAPTRDHTERLLRACGIDVATVPDGVRVQPGPLSPLVLRIPGDLSSAAPFLALAAARPGSRVRCPSVTLNPGRTGFLEVLQAMGALVEIEEEPPAAGVEPQGTVTVTGAPLGPVRVQGPLVPRCIDELPLVALLATQAEGRTVIAGAAELRVKESDRIAAVAAGLRALGAAVEEAPDGLAVDGPTSLRAARVDAAGDHRLAMAWGVAASLAAGGATEVASASCVSVSYPRFFEELVALTAR